MRSFAWTKLQYGLSILLLLVSGQPALSEELGVYHIDPNAISISGFSSGGFAAVQFQVAYSSMVMGAGIIAAGPYDCAEFDFYRASSICMCLPTAICSALTPSDLHDLVQATKDAAASNLVDATENLARQRVWVYGGSSDTLVPKSTVTALVAYYAAFIPTGNVHREEKEGGKHAMPTDASSDHPCSYEGDPYIDYCGLDGAHELLRWIYGDLAPKNTGPPMGSLVAFDQSAFIASPRERGMADTGWIYVPKSCTVDGALCRLHVVLHGCKQYPEYPYRGTFGTTFVDKAGYNQTADSNGIVVLYPQATAYTYVLNPYWPNPDGCWDWWGFNGSNYAFRDGSQMAAIKRMIDRVANLH